MRFTRLLLVIIVVGCSKGGSGPAPLSPTEKLAARVEEQRQLSAEAVAAYVPKVEGLRWMLPAAK